MAILMSDTLAALDAAIIETPTDRTVRLVYADALDESGDPANAVRAEFIRAQVELEVMADDDPRRPSLAARCTDLFAENWIDWWRPVCEAVGLPEPYVPGQGLGSRLFRALSGDKREPGSPYVAYPHAWSIHSAQHSFTAQFIAGFPELLALNELTLGIVSEGLDTWLTSTPLCRIRTSHPFPEFDWSRVGPHSTKLTELTFDRLSPVAATQAARFELRELKALRVGAVHPAADVVRALVRNPPWSGLRSLSLLGICAPDAIRALATDCTLTELEELSFSVGEVAAPQPITGIVGAIGAMATELLARFITTHPTPPGPVRAADYWPAIHALANSRRVGQLRCLRISDGDPGWVTRAAEAALAGNAAEVRVQPFLSDVCVRALAAGLNPDKLERLELPRTRLSPAIRDELTQRFGSRLALT